MKHAKEITGKRQEVAAKATGKCAKCPCTVQGYEHFCYNCDRYEPIDNYTGWCGNERVSRDGYCSSWK